jgi:hypothetical protein
MPVRKYRSIEEMPEPPWKRPGDPDLYRALARLWETARRLQPRQFPCGVYKHRSMEDMNRQRDEWDAAPSWHPSGDKRRLACEAARSLRPARAPG